MPPLLPAVGGALVAAGAIGAVLALRRTPPPARRRPRLPARIARIHPRTRALAAAGLAAGVLVWLLTGWLLAVAVLPLAAAGLPALLASPPSAARIGRLDALEEWTRMLAGSLVSGRSLEDALASTRRAAPDAIRPQVAALAKGLAVYDTETALRHFAADLADPAADRVITNLIAAAHARGGGLSAALQRVADNAAAEAHARRTIEADRKKPRTTARMVTIITLVVLAVLSLTGDYIAPYNTPLGRVVLAALLAAYAGLLVWMRRMAKDDPPPRLLGPEAGQGRLP